MKAMPRDNSNKRITTIAIGGRDYPANMSVKATEILGEKYGSLSLMSDKLAEMPDYVQLNEIIEIIHLVLEQGYIYTTQVCKKDLGVFERILIFLGLSNKKPPSVEELKMALGVRDIDWLYGKLGEVINGGTVTTVETKTEKKQ